MQINNVNSANPAFNGLWGKTTTINKSNVHFDKNLEADVGTYHFSKIKQYFPFKDETAEEINKVKLQNEYRYSKKSVHDYFSHNLTSRIDECIVNIRKTLPVTAKEYADYVSGKLLPNAKTAIETKLKAAKLQNFIK